MTWNPDQWQPVWAALLVKVPTLDPAIAPAWYASLQSWRPAEVLAAIQQLPAQLPAGQTRWQQLIAILAPPPPPPDSALVDAIRYAQAREGAGDVVEDRGQTAEGPRVHPAVVEAAAVVGFPWLSAVDRERVEHRVKWAEKYNDVLRKRGEGGHVVAADAGRPGRARPV